MDHLDDEALSAHLDGELTDAARARNGEHLAACRQCSQRLQAFSAIRAEVGSMAEVSLTIDEHRALRQAILQSRPEAKRRAAAWNWLLAGGLGTAVIVAFAVFFIGRESPQRAGTNPESATSAAQSFASDEQVRDAVASDPAVAAALRRSVDAGQDGGALKSQPQPGAASQPERQQSQDSAPQAPPAVGEDFSSQVAPAGAECLSKVGSARPRPTDPVLVRRVSYKAQDAWMLVYSSSSAPGGPRDQIEVWIISPPACASLSGDALLARSLHYSFFRPSP